VPLRSGNPIFNLTICTITENFRGFSYGFRPGRSQHNALDAIYIAVIQKKVSWIMDADIQGFFDNLDHDWLLKLIQHRISDKRILRWVERILKKGVEEEGGWSKTTLGTAQGSGGWSKTTSEQRKGQ
jgi:RNA-directed DNA polymerase